MCQLLSSLCSGVTNDEWYDTMRSTIQYDIMSSIAVETSADDDSFTQIQLKYFSLNDSLLILKNIRSQTNKIFYYASL